jgi:hypothetical protein
MIRHATLQDFDRIMEMMINFANSSPFDPQHNPEYNDEYIRRLLCNFMKNGVVLLGEVKGEVQGMLIAGISPDIWLPHVKTMKEVAWWVEPDHRFGTLGFRLLKEYVKCGEKLVENDIIDGFTLTNMEISPDFDLEKRGWSKIETNYIYEGV